MLLGFSCLFGIFDQYNRQGLNDSHMRSLEPCAGIDDPTLPYALNVEL